MSGHSKWSTIKRKKGATDQKRGQLFAKLSKNITLAARNGADPKTNTTLANAIEQARAENMPKENIERAIKKVSDKSAAQLQEVVVEAIGPGGVALKIKAVTDNSNRTISEIKKILGDHNSKMVLPNSITWMFNTPATISPEEHSQLDTLFEALDDQDDVDDVVSNLVEANS
ncbi:MAG: YebC/PmpR family DNA-binding transcriptional regulator [Candidatus Pacebacteria bacterium]|nr:YebC/PmpR family DNA-binding transcriptional regulator [Candidatus Paceibacterota bacterium]